MMVSVWTACVVLGLVSVSTARPYSLRAHIEEVVMRHHAEGKEEVSDALTNIFSGTKRTDESKRTGVDNTIDICYFCDANCRTTIGVADNSAVNAYFQSVTDQLAANIARLDPSLSVNYYYTAQTDVGIQLAWFGSDIGEVNTQFWSTGDLYANAAAFGCDAAFLFASSSDSLLATSGASGVANMFSICGEFSYGIVTAGSNPAPLLSHEVGHLLGMYHSDEEVDVSTFASIQSIFPAEYQALLDSCPDEECGDLCIMNSYVSNVANDYGACGRAYYTLMRTIAANFPGSYPASSCMSPPAKKRQEDDAAPAPSDLDLTNILPPKTDLLPPVGGPST